MKVPFIKTKKKLRSFDIPEENILDILELLDNVERSLKEKGTCRVAKYYLWNAISKYIPETINGEWHVKSTANSVTVVEGYSKSSI